jgi:leader peptidase (prepilin peptidase)/N-methyltransferase
MDMTVIVLVFGLIIGSFLNVCIYRLPRDLSVVKPRSACPSCNTAIKAWDNIPVISYILLGGKCRKCGEKISARYPLVEALNGLLYIAVFQFFGIGWHLPFLFAFVSAMVVITFIDLDFQIIPDVITLPGILIGLAAASFVLPDPFSSLNGSSGLNSLSVAGFTNSVTGLLTGGGLYYLIAVASRGGMGGGDIKMMAMVGAFTGWKGVLLTTFLGSLTGSIIGIFLMVFKGKGRKTKIPFGPFLALGSLISLFYGGIIVDWYLGM